MMKEQFKPNSNNLDSALSNYGKAIAGFRTLRRMRSFKAKDMETIDGVCIKPYFKSMHESDVVPW
jgi:hypothetical protein